VWLVAKGIAQWFAPTSDRGKTRYRRIAAATVSGVVGKGSSLLASALTIPLAVRYLGAEGYGLWVTISSAATMFLVMDIGIANTLTNLISEAYALDDRQKAVTSFSTALWVLISISTLLGLGAWAAWPHIHWVAVFHVLNPGLAAETSRAMAVTFVLFLVALPAGLAAKVLGGYQEMHAANLFAAAGSLLGLAGTAAVIAAHGSLPWMLAAFAGAPVVANIGCLLWICLIHKPWMRPALRHFDPAIINSIFRTGSQFFIIQVAGLVVFNSDSLIISHYLTPAQVTSYNVTWRIASYITAVPILLVPTLWPIYAEANARGDLQWIRSAYVRTRRLTLTIVATGCVSMLFAGKVVIRFWAGQAAVPGTHLLHLMCVWMFILAITLYQSCLMGAVNRVQRQALFTIIAAAANLGLSILWVRRFGPAGVLFATILSYLLFIVVTRSMEVRRILRGDFQSAPALASEHPC
jgi:O-antigen/teichoic acid export membrane protein